MEKKLPREEAWELLTEYTKTYGNTHWQLRQSCATLPA